MVRAAPTVTCWPSTARTAISLPSTWPGTRRPGRAATSGPSSGSRPSTSSTATGSQSASSSRRTRSTPAVVSRRSSSANVASTNAVWPGSSWSPTSRRTVPVPWGRARVRAYQPSPAASTPGTARSARNASRSRPAYGVRTARRMVTVPVDGWAPPRRPRSSVGDSGVDLADRVVELADAGEAGRERDLGELEVGGLDQHPRGLGPAGARQGERAGAELGGEQPAQVARRVADARRQTRRRRRGRRRRRR